ncbi:MAG: DUF167 domain-containing protein [Planctomycetes bacterium]|nr:DUF167 domain-containing protein [Planctomycetota bacterium]
MSEAELWVAEHSQGARFRVAARPNAGRNAVVGLHDGALKVQLNAQPEKGKANKALIAYLAKALGVSRSELSLVAGQTSRTKTLAVDGLGAKELAARLRRVLGE